MCYILNILNKGAFINETEYINDVCNTVANKMDNIDYIRKIISVSTLEHEKWLSHFTDEQITESIVDFLSLEPDTNQLSEEQMSLYGQKLFNLQAELAELQGVWDISFDDDGNCTSMIKLLTLQIRLDTNYIEPFILSYLPL